MDKRTPPETQGSSPWSAPSDWASLNGPMTEAQKWHLRFLSAEAKEAMEENLTKAQAARRINDLQAKNRRGKDRQ
jgi:hypothetical protein